MDEHSARAVIAAAELCAAVGLSLDSSSPVPAPVEVCEDIHAAMIAAYNILGKALYKFDDRVSRTDIRNQRARLKRLANQLESRHMRPRGQRFRQRGDA
jgi:hypothetical protein